MKRILVVMSICAALAFGISAAVAADGAALYKSCVGCHGADGSKQDGSYGGEKKAVMTNLVKRYSDEEMKAMADYMSKL